MKIIFISTVSNTVNTFLIPHIKMLIEQGHQVDVAFNIVQEVDPALLELGCIVHILSFERSPLKVGNIFAYRKLKKLIQHEQYDLVHTHTPVASALVRLACRNNRNIKVVYTAHGFHFFKGASVMAWVMYYQIERLLAKYTDLLITINREDYSRAKTALKAKEVVYVPGVGLDTKRSTEVDFDVLKRRKDLGIPENATVLLSVGELSKCKNHAAAIKAVAKLKNPNIHYLICGQGALEKSLAGLAKKVKVEEQVHLLGYRKDVFEICKLTDIFVFPSVREGLAVALLEAMASALPVVCSKIRGNIDLIEEGKGGYLVDPNDSDGYAEAIDKLCRNVQRRTEMGQHNLSTVQQFDIETIKRELSYLYDKMRAAND